MKTYGKIDEFKRMNIKVILNDNEVLYEGKVEDAPDNIKELHYNKALLGKITEIYIYDKHDQYILKSYFFYEKQLIYFLYFI